MKNLLRTATLVVFTCLFLGSMATLAEQPPGSLAGERVVVELVRWSTESDGKKKRTGEASTVLNVGQRGSLHASTGFVPADGGSAVNELCSNSIGGGGNRGQLADKSAHLWWVDVRVADASTERIELEVNWSRYDDGSEQPPTRSATRQIVLEEGDAHVLDFVEATNPELDQHCPLNVVFELQSRIVEDKQLSKKRIRYDLWLVDHDGIGNREVRISTDGRQGERVTPELEDLRWSLDGSPSTSQGVAEVIAELTTSLRGRVRRDGSVDLYLSAHRGVGVVPVGQPRRGGVGGGGSRLVNVRSGETVELVLPTPGGAHTQVVAGAGAEKHELEGVSVDGDRVRVEFEPFFRDHRLSLIVSATVVASIQG